MDEPVLLEHRERLEGMFGFGLWLPGMPFEGNREFVHRFSHRWEREFPGIPISLLLDHHAAAGHGAGQVLEAAVQAAGTLEAAAVRDALYGLDIVTVFGRFRLNESGVQVGKIVPVVGFRQGLREVLWPPRLRTAGWPPRTCSRPWASRSPMSPGSATS